MFCPRLAILGSSQGACKAKVFPSLRQIDVIDVNLPPGAVSTQIVPCQSGKKYNLPYVVYEKVFPCKNYPPSGNVTFRDILVKELATVNSVSLLASAPCPVYVWKCIFDPPPRPKCGKGAALQGCSSVDLCWWQVECDHKDCTQQVVWKPMVKDANCEMKVPPPHVLRFPMQLRHYPALQRPPTPTSPPPPPPPPPPPWLPSTRPLPRGNYAVFGHA